MNKAYGFLLLLVIAFLGACASDGTPGGGIVAPNPEDAIQTATGGSKSASTDKELGIQTGASKEGDVTQSSADVRNQEENQSTTSGHIQTLGFAGIGNAADMISKDPVMQSLLAEVNVLMQAEELDTERIDAVRAQMVAQSERLMASAATQSASFDGLKTIVAIFSMENQTGHEKTPLTDAAAASKADAFKAALAAIEKAVEKEKAEGE